MNWLAFSPAKWRAGMTLAFERFPYAILCGVIGAGCAIVGMHRSGNAALVGQCERLAMTVALGLPLFFSLRILRERNAAWRRWPLELLGVALLAGWWFTQSPRPSDEPEIVFIRWGLLLAALHFSAAVSPFVRGGEGPGFWQFNRRLFLRFALATLYTFVLTAGLELALLSADKLFELQFKHAYGDLWFFMVGCFHPTFFLAGVPRDFAALESGTEHPRGLKAFTQFALAPLVLVYGLILYAYAVKIVLLRTWPHGWVALPVLILSGVGIFSALLLHPLRHDPAERWARWFGRIFPPALGPLAVLLLLSLRVRISDYGVTEERYVGVVASVWILAWAIVFTVRRGAGIRWIPTSLAFIALAVGYGPWSAGSVSERSQRARVVAIVKAHGLWMNDIAQPAPTRLELPAKEGESLRSTIRYLLQMHGKAAVQSLFATPKVEWAKLQHWNAAAAVMDAMKLAVAKDESSQSFTRKNGAAMEIAGFRRMWEVTGMYRGPDAPWEPQTYGDLRVGLDHGVLKFAIGEKGVSEPIPLDELFAKLLPTGGSDEINEGLQTDFQRGERSFRIIFRSLQLQRHSDGPKISGTSFILLER